MNESADNIQKPNNNTSLNNRLNNTNNSLNNTKNSINSLNFFKNATDNNVHPSNPFIFNPQLKNTNEKEIKEYFIRIKEKASNNNNSNKEPISVNEGNGMVNGILNPETDTNTNMNKDTISEFNFYMTKKYTEGSFSVNSNKSNKDQKDNNNNLKNNSHHIKIEAVPFANDFKLTDLTDIGVKENINFKSNLNNNKNDCDLVIEKNYGITNLNNLNNLNIDKNDTSSADDDSSSNNTINKFDLYSNSNQNPTLDLNIKRQSNIRYSQSTTTGGTGEQINYSNNERNDRVKFSSKNNSLILSKINEERNNLNNNNNIEIKSDFDFYSKSKQNILSSSGSTRLLSLRNIFTIVIGGATLYFSLNSLNSFSGFFEVIRNRFADLVSGLYQTSQTNNISNSNNTNISNLINNGVSSASSSSSNHNNSSLNWDFLANLVNNNKEVLLLILGLIMCFGFIYYRYKSSNLINKIFDKIVTRLKTNTNTNNNYICNEAEITEESIIAEYSSEYNMDENYFRSSPAS